MKKRFPCVLVLCLAVATAFPQDMDFSGEDFSEEDFFSLDESTGSTESTWEDDFAYSDEDFFGSPDDDFFQDDGIEELVVLDEKSSAMAQGTLFEIGSVRVGGSFDTGLSFFVPLFREDDNKNFGERLGDSRLKPSAGASLFIDARPTSTLRLYTKFGINYPYKDSVGVSMSTQNLDINTELPEGTTPTVPDGVPDEWRDWIENLTNGASLSNLPSSLAMPNFSITNWLYLKELFTDFSIADRVFFRFGLHTVSWGAGFFFSPVSDMINTSSIDPEHTDLQVDGSLNLRTQITFPDSQNCLWLYVVPSTKTYMPEFSSPEEAQNGSLNEYMDDALYPNLMKEIAFAGKMDVVVSNWELGFGGVFKYQSAPKLMATASGSIINGKVGVFGELVLGYGSQTQWNENPEWGSKDLIFQGTVGAMYMWAKPQITFMGQYYFDSNKDDHEFSTYGNNLALTVNFAKLGETNLNLALFGLFYFGKTNMTSFSDAMEKMGSGKAFMPYAGILSATLTWNPISVLNISAGPYITWLDMGKAPDVSFRFGITLGGGKF